MECVNNLCHLLKPTTWYLPFSSIPFIGLGDFHQVAPVVCGHSVTPLILASIQSSYLCASFRILTLHQPHHSAEDPEFTAFVDGISKDYSHRQVSLSILERLQYDEDTIAFLFPPDILNNSVKCIRCVLLSLVNLYVDKFNALPWKFCLQTETKAQAVTIQVVCYADHIVQHLLMVL